MVERWETPAQYILTLTQGSARSTIEVVEQNGQSVFYREYEYWQRRRARCEAEALVAMARAEPVRVRPTLPPAADEQPEAA